MRVDRPSYDALLDGIQSHGKVKEARPDGELRDIGLIETIGCYDPKFPNSQIGESAFLLALQGSEHAFVLAKPIVTIFRSSRTNRLGPVLVPSNASWVCFGVRHRSEKIACEVPQCDP